MARRHDNEDQDERNTATRLPSALKAMRAKANEKSVDIPVDLKEASELMGCTEASIRRLMNAKWLPKLPVARLEWLRWFDEFGPEHCYPVDAFAPPGMTPMRVAPLSAMIRDRNVRQPKHWKKVDPATYDDLTKQNKWDVCKFMLACWKRQHRTAGMKARTTMRKSGKLARKPRPTGLTYNTRAKKAKARPIAGPAEMSWLEAMKALREYEANDPDYKRWRKRFYAYLNDTPNLATTRKQAPMQPQRYRQLKEWAGQGLWGRPDDQDWCKWKHLDELQDALSEKQQQRVHWKLQWYK